MKHICSIVLLISLILSICVGCNANNAEVSIDADITTSNLTASLVADAVTDVYGLLYKSSAVSDEDFEYELYSDDFITVYVKSVTDKFTLYENGLSINFRVVNKTNYDLYVNCSYLKLNNITTNEYLFNVDLPASGEKEDTLEIDGKDLEIMGFTSVWKIKNIAMQFKVVPQVNASTPINYYSEEVSLATTAISSVNPSTKGLVLYSDDNIDVKYLRFITFEDRESVVLSVVNKTGYCLNFDVNSNDVNGREYTPRDFNISYFQMLNIPANSEIVFSLDVDKEFLNENFDFTIKNLNVEIYVSLRSAFSYDYTWDKNGKKDSEQYVYYDKVLILNF